MVRYSLVDLTHDQILYLPKQDKNGIEAMPGSSINSYTQSWFINKKKKKIWIAKLGTLK